MSRGVGVAVDQQRPARPAGTPAAKATRALALVRHDAFNIVSLPVIFVLAVAGLAGWLPAPWVTNVFLAYIVFDFAWIALYPHSLPSKPGIILFHHVVTLGLLAFARAHPEFAHFTCWDGLTEINTTFMVLRRHGRAARRAMHLLYWATYIPLRLVMYPALIFFFWRALEAHSLAMRLFVCACQALLCAFNFGVFWLSVRRRVAGAMSPAGCSPTPASGAKPVELDELAPLKLRANGPLTRGGGTSPNVYIRASATQAA